MQEMKNPVTGEWEMMTRRQWWLIKHGIDRHSKVDDWTLAIIKGPAHAMFLGFGVNEHDNAGAVLWLTARYKEWFPKTPRGDEFKKWCAFIKDTHNLEKTLPLMDELHKLKKGIITTSIDSIQLQMKLKNKAHAMEVRQYKKNWK